MVCKSLHSMQASLSRTKGCNFCKCNSFQETPQTCIDVCVCICFLVNMTTTQQRTVVKKKDFQARLPGLDS